METIDDLCIGLLEEAKRFLEKAKATSDKDAQTAFCHAALLIAFSALEGHINAIAEELSVRPKVNLLGQSILLEREIALEKGIHILTKKLKIHRLEDRLEHIFANFTKKGPLSTHPWWGEIKNGLELRNKLVHPKSGIKIETAAIERSIQAILDCLDTLYHGLFATRYPKAQRGLVSTATF